MIMIHDPCLKNRTFFFVDALEVQLLFIRIGIPKQVVYLQSAAEGWLLQRENKKQKEDEDICTSKLALIDFNIPLLCPFQLPLVLDPIDA